jgi:hypothetical protein
MNPHEYNALHILHVLSALVLIGFTFYAFAAPAASRKSVMIWTGISSLLILVTGIRMWQGIYAFAGGWAVVKIVAWLGLSALAGLGYRRREKAGALLWVALVLSAVSVVMVYIRPF